MNIGYALSVSVKDIIIFIDLITGNGINAHIIKILMYHECTMQVNLMQDITVILIINIITYPEVLIKSVIHLF